MLIKFWSGEMLSLGGNMEEGLFFIKIPRATGFRNINISVSSGICWGWFFSWKIPRGSVETPWEVNFVNSIAGSKGGSQRGTSLPGCRTPTPKHWKLLVPREPVTWQSPCCIRCQKPRAAEEMGFGDAENKTRKKLQVDLVTGPAATVCLKTVLENRNISSATLRWKPCGFLIQCCLYPKCIRMSRGFVKSPKCWPLL